jgi:peroxiredoxin
MLGVGDRVPPVTVATAPNETTTLEQLVSAGPILLLFYLFDWSST